VTPQNKDEEQSRGNPTRDGAGFFKPLEDAPPLPAPYYMNHHYNYQQQAVQFQEAAPHAAAEQATPQFKQLHKEQQFKKQFRQQQSKAKQ
jgi:hypothetical protein